ncbi:hypothetical protein O181_056645 [Austropuccinia psidii MF-1]|uniref:Tf2-1-like SH3-like domain-containing protein n=1 Tax=Austropuccinia psidii MF-1 TaxID=1389203 RepID=A0A9Q3E6H2_9BASI|nr:hypothetical protein [Austropuccinia psidii MF-1]
MDWVTALPPGGDRSYNACLVLVDRYGRNPMFLPFYKDDKAMDTAIMIWNETNLDNMFGTKLSFSNAYHPRTDCLAERMIHTLEDTIRRFYAYGLELKDSVGFTHDWCWNHRLPYDTLKKDLVDIHPTESSFKLILDKARHHANRCMQDSFKYPKERWDESHKSPDFKIGDLVLVSTLDFYNIKSPKKLKDSFAGKFMIKALHGPNAVQLDLTSDFKSKHPTFPVSLIKPYSSSYKELFPLRNKTRLEIPPLEEGEEKKIVKVLE